MATVVLRIVVLQIQSDVWCELCGVPCAITVTYVEEVGDRCPESMHELTYCECCDERVI